RRRGFPAAWLGHEHGSGRAEPAGAGLAHVRRQRAKHQRQRPAHRHHGRQRRHPGAQAGRAGRHRGRQPDLPAWRRHPRRPPRCDLRHHHLRQDAGARRARRRAAVGIHADRLPAMGGHAADHQCHAGGRSRSAIHLRRVARRHYPEAGRRRWSRRLAHRHHPAAAAREDGFAAEVLHGRVIAVTAGYIGDRPPYQGHVAMLDGHSGKLLDVWNSLCSDRTGLLEPSSCPQSDSAIWGRAGAVIDPADGDIFVATGNADWNGKTDWGDAVVELDADATHVLGNYAPANADELNDKDLDLGSTSPVLLGGDLVAQGGKDGKIRLLSRKAIAGLTPHQGHELQIVSTPSGTDLFTQPAVWRHADQSWMFAADNGGTAAWQLENGQLREEWKNRTSGTSPFEADGLLFVYAREGGLNVYDAVSGKRVATLPCGPGHWNSPIVLQGEIILPEGNANEHATRGVLDIWSLPTRAP